MSSEGRTQRIVALTSWAYLMWILTTWTATVENLAVGAAVAVGCAVAMAPLGPVVGPWAALRPRRAGRVLVLAGECAVRIVRANLSLTRRILSPSRPLRSGMVITPTRADSDGEVAATGILTSLVVDNQLVDLDRHNHEFQYHAMAVPQGNPRETINGPIERRVLAVSRAARGRPQ